MSLFALSRRALLNGFAAVMALPGLARAKPAPSVERTRQYAKPGAVFCVRQNGQALAQGSAKRRFPQ